MDIGSSMAQRKITLPLFILLILSINFSGYVFAQAKFDQGYEAAQSGNYKKAVQIWLPLANSGNTAAQYTLGWLYESGQGVKQDHTKAAHWYQQAANKGNDAAQYALATMYAKGNGVEKSNKKALELFTLAANQGDAISQYQVGKYYHQGLGIEKDDIKSVFWYKKAAQQGHITAQINLGSMYQAGNGVKKNYKKAIQWYESAAKQNNALAQYQLAHMYEYGQGEKLNYNKAIELYTKSANNNYSQSAFKLGYIFETGQGTKVNFKKAITWYRQAALQGNTNAQFRLGLLSQTGNGTEKNIQKAITWYTEASRRDHAQAYYQLAEIYEYGTKEYKNNITINLQKAFKNYQHASLLNYHLAHAKLAYFYENSIFTSLDTQKAISLYQKATQSWAKLRLATLLQHQQCLETASTRLFFELISCANRHLLRSKIKQQSIKVLNENDQKWTDTYFTGAVIKGTSELAVDYTREDDFARATYTFVGRNNASLIVQLKNQLALRYGEPTSHQGDVLEGKASFQWILEDGIILNIYRNWPNTTTFVEYVQPENHALQIKQQAQSMNKQFKSEEQLAREPHQAAISPFF